MKYCQIDQITSLQPGKKLTGQRTLRADEEYLLDHFPRFPVMPGVMMLEALHQAAIWLIRSGDDFRSPLVLLREAKAGRLSLFPAIAKGPKKKQTSSAVQNRIIALRKLQKPIPVYWLENRAIEII